MDGTFLHHLQLVRPVFFQPGTHYLNTTGIMYMLVEMANDDEAHFQLRAFFPQ